MTNEEIIAYFKDLSDRKLYFGYSHTLKVDNDRLPRYYKQHQENGFDDTETWGLDTTLSNLILPRLKRFREVNNGYPVGITENQWLDKLDSMIMAFEFSVHKYEVMDRTDKENEQIKQGLKDFAEGYYDLWW